MMGRDVNGDTWEGHCKTTGINLSAVPSLLDPNKGKGLAFVVIDALEIHAEDQMLYYRVPACEKPHFKEVVESPPKSMDLNFKKALEKSLHHHVKMFFPLLFPPTVF